MTLREKISPAKEWAHGVLDDVRAGVGSYTDDNIRAALRLLGETVNV